jgi:hypothetical protein
MRLRARAACRESARKREKKVILLRKSIPRGTGGEQRPSRRGGPPFAKLGRRVVYRREDLDAWLTERRRSSTSEIPRRNA